MSLYGACCACQGRRRGFSEDDLVGGPGRRSGAWAALARAGSGIAKLLKGAPAIYRHAGCRVVLPVPPVVGCWKLTQSSDTFACAG